MTESGTLLPGTVKSSVALGILLSEGIGDTVRVSLTDRPEREVLAGMEILRSLAMRSPGPSITSCPTCGRTKVDLFTVASKVEEAMESLYAERARTHSLDGAKFPHVAVMGCAVNGPGEAKGADIALCGANGDFVLYVRGQMRERVSAHDAPRKVVEYAVSLWQCRFNCRSWRLLCLCVALWWHDSLCIIANGAMGRGNSFGDDDMLSSALFL